jgi:PAS domain S-box-containing protein
MPLVGVFSVVGDQSRRPASARPLQRPLAWLLIGAVALPAAILAAGGWIAWSATWREARIELARQADASAEYGTRLLLNYSIAASRIDDLLHGLTDAEIRAREAELHAAVKTLVADLPQASVALVADHTGMPLLAANRLPVPREVGVADRDYFLALRNPDAPTVHVSDMHVGRFTGSRFFAVSRRRTGTGNPPRPDGFDGLVNVHVQPELVAEGLRRHVTKPWDAIALIRADGSMLARSSDPGGLLPRLPENSRFRAVADAGLREATYRTHALDSGEAYLVSVRQLDGFPLFASAVRPRHAILAEWRRAMLPQLAVGLPAMLALLGLALLVRRAQHDLLSANDRLEARVAERTAALADVSEALDLTPFMITDLDGHIRHWSSGCTQLYGFPREEALGRFVTELLNTEFPEGGRPALMDTLYRHGQWQGELRQRRRDGTPIVTATQWTLRYDPHTGKPSSVVSTRTDLSPLRRAERALSRSEARLQRAQEAGGVIAFEIAEDGTVVADAALPRLFGLPDTAPLTIDRFFDRMHPEDRDTVAAVYRRMANEGGSFAEEFRVDWPDGTQRWLLARGEAEPDPAGGPIPRRLVGITIDVTQRRAAEAALAESGERLRLAQAAAGFGIYDYDFATRTVTWDAPMRAFWALPEGVPVTSRLFVGGLHPDDRPLRRAAIRRALDAGGTGAYQVEYRVIGLTDGQERWISATGQVRFAGGRPVRLTGLALDVTARKRAEQRNELLMREVDHRAKNALAVVQAALRLSRAETPAELVRIVEGRVAALARAQTILAKRRWEGAELRALLEGELAPFLTGVRRDAPRAELAGPPVTVAAHAAQPLSMAVHELATNAMKYGALSHPGGLLQVTWKLDATSRKLMLVWRETGGPEIGVMPGQRGFGSRVIEQTVQGQLGGTVHRRWLPGGLLCEMVVPLSRTAKDNGMVLDGEAAANAAA